jgi:hypothetical protein
MEITEKAEPGDQDIATGAETRLLTASEVGLADAFSQRKGYSNRTAAPAAAATVSDA